MDTYYEMTETEPDLSPPFDMMYLLFQLCQDVIFVALFFYCLVTRNQLWRIINEAQLCYHQLTSSLKKRFVLRCSKLMKLMAIAQLFLLVLMCLQITWLDWPRLDEFYIVDYILGVVRLLFVCVLTLQFFYHLLNAALLQSLNRLLQQQRNLKLLHRVLNVQPSLKRMQHFAACYFGILFFSFFVFLYLRCGMFIAIFSYDEQRFTVDEDNPAAEMSMPPTRDELLRVDALYLAWQMAMMWLLLGAALLQQREQKQLSENIWKMDFQSAAEASGLSKGGLISKDIQSFLLTTRLSIVDFRPSSMNFLSWKLTSTLSRMPLVAIVSAFKLLLQVMLFSTLVYFA
ncbi:uncharacterized protein LOC117572163 [Drosophila albomicans]|uniref:Uncharacterized protein LOC117572163 n=1 Tax=Drosophila albomicans TaxID=7291 RepID=A0A6P8XDE2_DROAB|nr:uncharacterized protein LOC117572163 [Drosophila albomicans]